MNTHTNITTTDKQTKVPNETPPVVDAKINVSIANNGLEGYLNITPPRNGGAPPTFNAMKAALSEHGISYNIDIYKLKAIDLEPVYNSNILIASGVAPVNGIDGTASFQIDTEKKSPKPMENSNGTVDFHDLDNVQNVTQGQVLCTITLPTDGSPGVSVKGKQLSQNKGRPVQSFLGKNTELNNDGTAILSKIKGQVEFDGRKLNVSDVFYVRENVDYTTGNIKVSSDLVILGMVMPGFGIEAEGNIDVMGTVQTSMVKAGGSINLQNGIIGSELYCDGDFNCKFIENCSIHVKGEITAKSIINSNIKCGKSIKAIGSSARIIGGSYMAGQNIEAHTIGSVANIKTKLELSTDYTIINRQQELLNQTTQIENQNKKLKPLIALLQQLEASARLTPEKRQALDKAIYSYNNNIKLFEAGKKELEEIAQSLEKRGIGRIVCSGTIHPNTHAVIGKANLSIKNALNNVSLFYNQGEIGIDTA